MPFGMKESDLKRRPPFNELLRKFVVKCPVHGEVFVQETGHHVTTISRKPKKKK
jgi:hypothetical protein